VVTAVDRPLAIIAGGGSIPRRVADAALLDGRKVLIIGIDGEADSRIADYPHGWFKWGNIGHLENLLAEHGTRDVVLVGGVKTRPDFRRLKLDFRTIRILPEILSIVVDGDNTVLTGAIRFIEKRGYSVIGAHEIAPDLVAEAGAVTRNVPRSAQLDDAKTAMNAARSIGLLDAGQASVVVNGRVVALEAAEGTDAMLRRVAELRDGGRLKWSGRAGALAKCPKPQQDLRVDMPTIGPQTVDTVAAAGLAGIAIESGRVMIVDREETKRRAEAAGLFIFAFPETGEAT